MVKHRKEVPGKRHLDILSSIAILAATYRGQGLWAEAEELEVEVMERTKAKLVRDYPDMLSRMANFAPIWAI